MTPPDVQSRLVCPFRLGLDHMERLVVVGLRDDPEFTGIEPQVFDDPRNGRGMRILRYRKDGRVDIYQEPGMKLNREDYTFGAGIADFCETQVSPAVFEIGPGGLRLDVGFRDAQGRETALRIVEGGPSRGFPMLAPVGAEIRAPRMLFLVLMRSIALLRRRWTEFDGRIGDRSLAPQGLPIPLNGAWVWFTRYCEAPVIATLNPASEGPLVADLPLADGEGITLGPAGDVLRLAAGTPEEGAEMRFAPGFPNLAAMEPGQRAEGRWTLSICGTPITAGTYTAHCDGASADVDLRPTEPWRPGPLPLAIRGLVTFVPSFRTWPTTYAWSGRVDLGPKPEMRGAWSRVGGA